MALKRISQIVANTRPISAYGGIRLSEAAAEQMASQLRTGTIPMTFNHRSDRIVAATIVDAYTKRDDDGVLHVWVDFDVPAEEWDSVLKEIHRGGAPGGFSYTTIEAIDGPNDAPIEVAADAHHFSDADISAAATEFARSYPTRSGRAYQFSFVPDAAVFVTFAASVVAELPSDVLATLIFTACKSFVRPGRESTFNFSVKKRGDRLSVKIRVASSNVEEFAKAIERVPDSLRAALEADLKNDPSHRPPP